MKGDFTRCKFDTEKHYRSVRMQQGRVLLDSDWNEQMEIESHLSRAAAIDAAGIVGGSLQNAGFAIISDKEDIEKCRDASVLAEDKSLEEKIGSLTKGDFLITRGRYYVGGILCENGEHTCYRKQKNFPDPLGFEDGNDYLVYLDVWERPMTSVEDPDIREIALGGPDTTSRVETLWQVKAKNIENSEDDFDCKAAAKELSLHCARKGEGLLSVSLGTVDNEGDQDDIVDRCQSAPEGQYRGQDNHLYRVEIHQGGHPKRAEENEGSNDPEYATFKWSKDNGSLLFAAEFLHPDAGQELQTGSEELSSLRIKVGPYPISMLKAGDWVEILDDGIDLLGRPGTFVQIKDIDAAERIVTVPKIEEKYTNEKHLKIRKWDGGSPKIIEVGEDGKSFELGDGIILTFSGDNFHAGDYWTFRARALTGDVDTFQDMPPEGIEHNYCALAILGFRDGKLSLKEDCRRIFLSLTELTDFVNHIEQRTELSYVGGSGQEGRRGRMLKHPLHVGVSSLKGPISHVWVKFEVLKGDGHLKGHLEGRSEDGHLEEGHLEGIEGGESAGNAIEVETSDDGIAGCCWVLGNSGAQQVMATLRDKKDLPVFFYADFLLDPDFCLRMEISRYGIIIAVLGMLGCLIGMIQEQSRWFVLLVFIAFTAMLIASIVLKKTSGDGKRF